MRFTNLYTIYNSITMRNPHSPLPIDAVLPELLARLQSAKSVVLHAPPGAGKTTRVPLALLEHDLFPRKIIMLEPRRLAARNAALRMAQTLGQPIGRDIGYRMRGETIVGPDCKIEVVTEGILARIIQSDPQLADYDCVIFDEFHERSIHADFALALCCDIRSALRDDLHLIIMSATLDGAPVAKLLNDAPIINAKGRIFNITEHFLKQPWRKPQQGLSGFENAMAAQIINAAQDHSGGILAFLPGQAEIENVKVILAKSTIDGAVYPLYGALPYDQQTKAIGPSATRKIVLATAIAETSLTIEGIDIVIDGGLTRKLRFDPNGAMSRLLTQRVSKAEATQRAGRSGRLREGTVYKLWTKGENGALRNHTDPEIMDADLVPLVLAMADWGVRSASELAFLTPPRPSDIKSAQHTLYLLGALDKNAAITPLGRALARQPTHPRLARAFNDAGRDGPALVALIEGRDILAPPAPTDFTLRWQAYMDRRAFLAREPYQINMPAYQQAKARQKNLPKADQTAPKMGLQCLLALAYPDRIGVRRNTDHSRYHLSNGRGLIVAKDDPLTRSKYIVAIDVQDRTGDVALRQGIAIEKADLLAIFADQIEHIDLCIWDKKSQQLHTQRQLKLGSVVIDNQNWADCPSEIKIAALCDGIRDLGLKVLNWDKRSIQLRARVIAAHNAGVQLPDWTDQTLIVALEDWLGPYLVGVTKHSDFAKIPLYEALSAMLDYQQTKQINHFAPEFFTTPGGRKIKIDYADGVPKIAVRLQELFGLRTHPTVGAQKQPILIELLSPANRSVQITRDIVGFWMGSYQDVRKDMRGRYPKHHWPDDPLSAQPKSRYGQKQTKN